MKRCSKCKKEKSSEEFNFKNKDLKLRQCQCKECTRLLVKNHYNKNKQYYLKKAKKRNLEIKTNIVNYLQNYLSKKSCIDCGESDIAVLEFDHINRSTKFKAVSTLVRLGYPIKIIQAEINKCDVRCANCHRRKTSKDFKWLKVKMPL